MLVIDLMFTVEEIQKIIDEADRQQLDGREILHRLPPETATPERPCPGLIFGWEIANPGTIIIR